MNETAIHDQDLTYKLGYWKDASSSKCFNREHFKLSTCQSFITCKESYNTYPCAEDDLFEIK